MGLALSSDGVLYGVDDLGNRLVTIDRATGLAISVAAASAAAEFREAALLPLTHPGTARERLELLLRTDAILRHELGPDVLRNDLGHDGEPVEVRGCDFFEFEGTPVESNADIIARRLATSTSGA